MDDDGDGDDALKSDLFPITLVPALMLRFDKRLSFLNGGDHGCETMSMEQYILDETAEGTMGNTSSLNFRTEYRNTQLNT